jgi:Cytochrome c554 and c-prime
MKRLLSVLIVVAALGASLAALAAEGEHAYVGSQKCKACHIKEYKSWSETKMANAIDILKPGGAADAKKAAGLDPAKDYTHDKTCLPCHTTGYGKTGGFVDMETTPALAGVGCEMCHGPGGTYTQKQYMSLQNKAYKKADLVAVGLVAEVGAAQCTGCHNEKNPAAPKPYKFDYAAKKDQGMHENFPLKYPH